MSGLIAWLNSVWLLCLRVFPYRSWHLYAAWSPRGLPWRARWDGQQNVRSEKKQKKKTWRACVKMCVLYYISFGCRTHRSETCGPSRGGSMLPAPRRQCCTMARLCNSSSLWIRAHVTALSRQCVSVCVCVCVCVCVSWRVYNRVSNSTPPPPRRHSWLGVR